MSLGVQIDTETDRGHHGHVSPRRSNHPGSSLACHSGTGRELLTGEAIIIAVQVAGILGGSAPEQKKGLSFFTTAKILTIEHTRLCRWCGRRAWRGAASRPHQ